MIGSLFSLGVVSISVSEGNKIHVCLAWEGWFWGICIRRVGMPRLSKPVGSGEASEGGRGRGYVTVTVGEFCTTTLRSRDVR